MNNTCFVTLPCLGFYECYDTCYVMLCDDYVMLCYGLRYAMHHHVSMSVFKTIKCWYVTCIGIRSCYDEYEHAH